MSFFNSPSDSQPLAGGGQNSFFDEDDAEDPPSPLAGPSRPRPAATPPARRTHRSESANPWANRGLRGSSEIRTGDENGGGRGFSVDLGEVDEVDMEFGDEEKRVEGLPEETLTEELTRYWWNERCAPEVLMQRERMLEEAIDRIKQQSDALQTLLASPGGMTTDQHFRLTLIETEVEQLRHICKAYARCRMYKLDKYFDHCLSDPYARARLSPVDLQYCEREQALVHNLLYSTILEGLPPKYRRLDEEEMIIRPDLDQAVFVCARKHCESIALPDTTSITLEAGSRHFMRYRTVRALVESGEVMLI